MTNLKTYSNQEKLEFRYKIDRLKKAVDAERLLGVLGFNITSVNSREIRAQCKIHGGDNRTAFRMNTDTKTWCCYTKHCQEELGYDVISLIKAVLKIDFTEALGFLENFTGINVNDDASFIKYKQERDRYDFICQQNDNRIVPPAIISEEYLNNFKKFRSSYFENVENGGFPKHVLDAFEIGGGYIDRYGYQRDVIPIRDKDGRLTAFSFRDITGKASNDYKYILNRDFEKDKVLYNLNNAKNNMGDNRTLIIVEGFKSVWRLFLAGFKNVVACMGSRITNGQKKLLFSNAFNIVVLFDMDDSGVSGTKSVIKDMGKDINVIPIFLPYTKTDPADYTVEDIKDVLGGI